MSTVEDLAALYPEVDRFRVLMLRELEANSRKGDQAGWLRADPEWLLHDITWHWAKLAMTWRAKKHALGSCRDTEGCADPLGCDDHAPIDSSLQEHAADVANMSLMFLDRLGLLPCCDDGPTGHTEQEHHDASPCIRDCPLCAEKQPPEAPSAVTGQAGSIARGARSEVFRHPAECPGPPGGCWSTVGHTHWSDGTVGP